MPRGMKRTHRTISHPADSAQAPSQRCLDLSESTKTKKSRPNTDLARAPQGSHMSKANYKVTTSSTSCGTSSVPAVQQSETPVEHTKKLMQEGTRSLTTRRSFLCHVPSVDKHAEDLSSDLRLHIHPPDACLLADVGSWRQSQKHLLLAGALSPALS